MQKDLDKLRRSKRRLRRILAVLAITALSALIVVGVKSCSDQYKNPYNKEYRPLDKEPQNVVEPRS